MIHVLGIALTLLFWWTVVGTLVLLCERSKAPAVPRQLELPLPQPTKPPQPSLRPAPIPRYPPVSLVLFPDPPMDFDRWQIELWHELVNSGHEHSFAERVVRAAFHE